MKTHNRHKSFFSRSLVEGVLIGLSGPSAFLYPIDRHSYVGTFSVTSAWKKVGISLTDAMNSEGEFIEKREKSDFKSYRETRSKHKAVA